MTTARFVNLNSHPVSVRTPSGAERSVRPFRELAAFAWRKTEDCVCEGEHYANFPGLLSPFPGDAPDGSAVAVQAPKVSFKATGEVRRADGTLKVDGDQVGTQDGSGLDPVPPEAVEPESDDPDDDQDGSVPDDADTEEEVTDDEEGEGEDDAETAPEDAPLEEIPGVTRALAKEIRRAGFATTAAVADCQSKAKLKKLAGAKGVDTVEKAESLVDAAQTLLGWE